LGKEKVLGLNEVVAIIRIEKSRKGLMFEIPTTESSVMINEGWNNPRSSVHIRSSFPDV